MPPDDVTPDDRAAGRSPWPYLAALVLLASTLPFLRWIVYWWRHNDLALVSFSLMMPPAAAAATAIRLRYATPRVVADRQRTSMGVLLAGLFAVGSGLLGWLGEEPFLGAVGLWLALVAISGVLRSPAVARRVALPLSPLMLMAPLTRGLPARFEAALQHTSAWTAEQWLRLFGVTVDRDGLVLYTPSFFNRVDDTCSGVATFSALFVLALLLAIIADLRDRALLVVAALSLPIALLANGARIAWVSILGERGGAALAMGEMHDITGYVTFGVAYALVFVLVMGVRRRQRRIRARSGSSASRSARTSESGPSR